VRESLLRVWVVDLLVAVRVLPLQALSLPLLPLPWTLPRLLSLQLANPASVVEGVHAIRALAPVHTALNILPRRAMPFYAPLFMLPAVARLDHHHLPKERVSARLHERLLGWR
jgi:hypothetical protein